jgi:CheY-like chemotaxis protein
MKANGDTPRGSTKKALRILIAEDSPLNQQVALKQLEALGYQADAVADGEEVLAALDRGPYDIILMDCHMPEMSGYEATWQIRDRQAGAGGKEEGWSRPYIIAMTANTEADSREKCEEAGMDDYVSKPVQLAELEAALLRGLAARVDLGVPAEIVDPVVITGLRQIRRPGQPDPVIELVDLFVREAPQQLEVMNLAASKRQVSSLSELLSAATRLKGSAFNLGARGLAAMCDEIEQGAKSWSLEEVLPLIQRAQEEFVRVKEALEKIKADASSGG